MVVETTSSVDVRTDSIVQRVLVVVIVVETLGASVNVEVRVTVVVFVEIGVGASVVTVWWANAIFSVHVGDRYTLPERS